ncbi:hypothetical protein K457DRAFT_1814842 [Linnemannia elongata AG-77]|uniref:Uncharacterized protein n=1 Tax=Linnemannia elongata AG-77 TaxID=1314771 RepID=A0A197KE73_9FUNG|nr:hypothetical protein K457DRAFT_1814842 [Linnemannia elongata AG-77]
MLGLLPKGKQESGREEKEDRLINGNKKYTAFGPVSAGTRAVGAREEEAEEGGQEEGEQEEEQGEVTGGVGGGGGEGGGGRVVVVVIVGRVGGRFLDNKVFRFRVRVRQVGIVVVREKTDGDVVVGDGDVVAGGDGVAVVAVVLYTVGSGVQGDVPLVVVVVAVVVGAMRVQSQIVVVVVVVLVTTPAATVVVAVVVVAVAAEGASQTITCLG